MMKPEDIDRLVIEEIHRLKHLSGTDVIHMDIIERSPLAEIPLPYIQAVIDRLAMQDKAIEVLALGVTPAMASQLPNAMTLNTMELGNPNWKIKINQNFNDKNIENFFRKTDSSEAEYSISFDETSREILINNIIVVSKPRVGGWNFYAFKFLFNNANKELSIVNSTKEIHALHKKDRIDISAVGNQNINDALKGLGFRNALREVFFDYSSQNDTVRFHNPIYKERMQKLNLPPLRGTLKEQPQENKED